MATDPIALDRQAGRLAALLQPRHRPALSKAVITTPPGEDIVYPYRDWLEDPKTVPIKHLLTPMQLTTEDARWVRNGDS